MLGTALFDELVDEFVVVGAGRDAVVASLLNWPEQEPYGGGRAVVRLTQQEIGELVGASRESVGLLSLRFETGIS
jgi:Bacterial regulatory proteins, crp family